MPTGTPYNALVLPYCIRVDDFGSTDFTPTPLLHLLSHTHTDHLNGLSARSFGYTVYCSKDAKEMLLRHEVYAERENREMDLRVQNVRTYAHLKMDPLVHSDGSKYYTGSRDLLKTLPLDHPTEIELSGNETVTLTLLDANHCPGAVMFLIEGSRGAVLHTGDFRAEPWFLESITRNPFLQPYLYARRNGRINKPLEAIYLDTACVLSSANVPTKASATKGLVEMLELFPESVYFFINSWTWGYEDVLKAIALAFQTQIHVDRYKHSIYQNVHDRYLQRITTLDSSSTRFHACERFSRCQHVLVENERGVFSNATSATGKRVVYVNPVTMDIESWNTYLLQTKEQLRKGETINNILVPLSRHSPLPELKAFVSLFRPKRIVPNTLDPRLHGLDWACIDEMFSECLHPSSKMASSVDIDSKHLTELADSVKKDCDVAFKNLVGEGAEIVAAKWADDGKLEKKLEVLRLFLAPKGSSSLVDKLLGKHKPSEPEPKFKGRGKEPMRRNPSSGEDTDTDTDGEADYGRTAHFLFASQAGIEDKENSMWWDPSSQPDSQDILASLDGESAPGSSPTKPGFSTGKGMSGRRKGLGVKDGSFKMNTLNTPPSSTPVRPQPKSTGFSQSPLVGKSGKARMTSLHSGHPEPLSQTGTAIYVSSIQRGSGSLASPIQLSSSPIPEKAAFMQDLLSKEKGAGGSPLKITSTSGSQDKVVEASMKQNKAPSLSSGLSNTPAPRGQKVTAMNAMRVEPPPRAVATRALSRSGSVIKTPTRFNKSLKATPPSLSPSPVPSSPPTLSPEKMGPSAEEEEKSSASATRGKRAASPLPSALRQEGPVVKKRKLDLSKTLPDMLPDTSSSQTNGHRQPTKHEEGLETEPTQPLPTPLPHPSLSQPPSSQSRSHSRSKSSRHQRYSKEKIESEHRRIVEGARMARAIPEKFTPQFYAFHLNMLKKYGVPPDYKPLEPPPGWTGDFALPATQTQHRSSTLAPTPTSPPTAPTVAIQASRRGATRAVVDVGGSASQPRPLVGHKTQLIESFEPVEEEADRKMDWERSRQLAETFRSEMRLGKRPTLPKLLCTSMGESQSQTQSESQQE